MQVELLYFDGCPSHEELLSYVTDLLAEAAVDAAFSLRRVESHEAAVRERFLGSPTLRINGEDVDPGAGERADFGLKCRLYATPSGLRGRPADEWVLDALAGAGARSPRERRDGGARGLTLRPG